eukprot:SAG31_NODE_3407_length_4307_cov_8.014971_2_plen_203_part_00
MLAARTPHRRVGSGMGLSTLFSAAVLLGLAANVRSHEVEDDSFVVTEAESETELVDDEDKAALPPPHQSKRKSDERANAPRWATDPAVQKVMMEPRVKALLDTMTSMEGAEMAKEKIQRDPELVKKFRFLKENGVFSNIQSSGHSESGVKEKTTKAKAKNEHKKRKQRTGVSVMYKDADGNEKNLDDEYRRCACLLRRTAQG